MKLRTPGPVAAAAIAVTSLGAVLPAPALAAAPAAYTTSSALAVTGGAFVPLTPHRVLDTRNAIGAPRAKVAGHGTVSVTVAGVAGVPASNVSAVVVNVTVTDALASGFTTVYPGGTVRPAASNLNFVAGQTVANLVTVGLGGSGQVSLFNGSSASVDLLADVAGYYVGGTATVAGSFVSLTPKRILDTRNGIGTVKKALRGKGKLDVTVQGAGGVNPAGAAAVVMNITVTDPTSSGYLTVYPAGGVRPTASNLNFAAGKTVPNLVTVALGTSGHVTIYNGSTGSVEVIADVAGYYRTGTASAQGTFVPLAKPSRILDTRNAVGVPGTAAIAAAHEVGLQTLDGNTVPLTGVAAVAMNVTSTGSTRSGYVTVSPTDPVRPSVSTLNHAAGQTLANAAIVPAGLCGKTTFYNGSTGATHVIADVAGYFIGAGGSANGNLVGWGENSHGLVGDGSIKSTKTPIDVMGLQNVTAVGNGLAVVGNDSVWAWGPNELSRLYNGAASRDQGYRNCSIPERVPGLSSIKAVAGTPASGYALDSAGKVWAWGVNSRGQLGDGSTTASFTPKKVPALAGSTFIAISAGFAVRSDHTVWGWGDNTYGQLGSGASGSYRTTPIQVAGLSGVTDLSQQGATEYALLSDHTVLSWGANLVGALGQGWVPDSDAHPTPANVAAVGDPGHPLTGVASIAGAMALLTDNSVVTWGSNSVGQLGNQSIGVVTTTPVLPFYPPGGAPDFTEIASSGNVDLALAADHTVWAWGAAWGNGSTANTGTMRQIGLLTNAQHIGAGTSAGFAIQ